MTNKTRLYLIDRLLEAFPPLNFQDLVMFPTEELLAFAKEHGILPFAN